MSIPKEPGSSSAIRVLVADDSMTIRRLLSRVINLQPDMEVVGEAADGLEAVRLATELEPDVITMDVNMPGLNGYEATATIMKRSPRPIMVVSSQITGRSGESTIRALAEGALAALPKPSPRDEASLAKLVATLRDMAGSSVLTLKWTAEPAHIPDKKPKRTPESNIKCVCIGVSTGGPQALGALFGGMVPLAAPIVVVQHITTGFTSPFVSWLDSTVKPTVELLQPDQALKPGRVYVAPEQAHARIVRFGRDGIAAKLDWSAPEREGFRPSADVLFESAAKAFPGHSLGIIMTGMGRDGARGLKAMKDAGCLTFAQSSESCVVDGMPKAARELEATAGSLDLSQLAQRTQGVVGPLT